MSEIQAPVITLPVISAVSITNIDEFNSANELLIAWKEELKIIDADEKNITAPINKSLKEIRAKYKPVKDRCEQAITILREALNAYKRLEDAKREADKKAIEDLVKDGASFDDLVELSDERQSLGGRLTTIVTADKTQMTAKYKEELLDRVWGDVMLQVRKDVSAGRVEPGVTVTKEKRI